MQIVQVISLGVTGCLSGSAKVVFPSRPYRPSRARLTTGVAAGAAEAASAAASVMVATVRLAFLRSDGMQRGPVVKDNQALSTEELIQFGNPDQRENVNPAVGRVASGTDHPDDLALSSLATTDHECTGIALAGHHSSVQ